MHYFEPRRCESSGKIMYHDRGQAQRAAERSRMERGVELWTYHCDFCGTWHLTHCDPDSRLSQGIRGNHARRPGTGSRKRGYKPRRR